MTLSPEIWGGLSVALALFSLGPYLWATLKGTNKPHVFTWVIWTLLTGIAFLIQYLEGAGSGAWSGGISTVFCLAILLASFRHGEKHITRSDWAVFLASLAAILVWLVTQNPVTAAIWVTVIDSAGYIPTLRKVWNKPHEEMATTHGIAACKHVFVLLAVQNYVPATIIYSVGMVIMNMILVTTIILRRRLFTRVT
ncbi:MAG: hypothetical protein RBR86_08245 [Pseudobdellovibrionaceae bacterium]|jgi:hypothetical protein|nr:hypothetical protein [Pseudobdellovibrionaceae bacterium]